MRLAALAAVSLVLAGPAQAGVGVYGPPSATRVLVLMPGLGGGAGNFALVAPELVSRVPNLQVWTVDRRGDDLEDTTGFATGDPAVAYGYYLGGARVNGRAFDPNAGLKTPQARSWGAGVALADLRKVVLEARAGGKRKAILGGHSIGAATAATYAAWDFGGHPGYEDLAGLVLIDGGELSTFGTPTNAEFFSFGLAAAGIDAKRCGLENAAAMVGAARQNAFDWYFPTRFRIDLLAAASLRPDPVTRLLGLRVSHLPEIDLPLYAFATGDIPATLTGARALLAQSRSPRAKALLAADPAMRQADPLCTPYERSRFLQTLASWLRR